MYKHIVVWKLKEVNKAKNLMLMKDLLEGLKLKITEIVSLDVSLIEDNTNPFDIILYTEFKDKEALEKYLVHPSHQEVADLISDLRLERYVFDYEK